MTKAEQPFGPAHSRGRAGGRANRILTILGPLTRIPTPIIFGVSIAIALAVLLYQGLLQDVIDVIRGADVALLVLAAPIYVTSLGLLCLRWHLLVRMAQGVSNLPRASEAFLTSVVINYAAPIGLAVPSRAALTKRALGLDASTTGTIAVWEVGMDILVLGAGTLLWLAVVNGSADAVGGELSGSLPAYAVAGAVLVAMVTVCGWWFMRTADRRARLFRTGKRIFFAPRERPREAALAVATSALYWVVQGVVLALLLTSFGVATSFQFVLGLTSLPILVGMLSPVPGGAVVRESLMYAVARLADVPGDPVIAAALVYRVALFAAIPILYGVTRWWITRGGDATWTPRQHEESTGSPTNRPGQAGQRTTAP